MGVVVVANASLAVKEKCEADSATLVVDVVIIIAASGTGGGNSSSNYGKIYDCNCANCNNFEVADAIAAVKELSRSFVPQFLAPGPR